jgi:hypothetical protein
MAAVSPVSVFPMSYNDYLNELSIVSQREKSAREEVAALQSQVENLKLQLLETRQRIATVEQERSSLSGAIDQEIQIARIELDGLKNALDKYLLLFPEEIWLRRAEIDLCEEYVDSLRVRPACRVLTDKVDQVVALFGRVRSRIRPGRGLSTLSAQVPVASRAARASPRTHCVVGREGMPGTLSSIAQQVYGDKFQWPRIYRANRTLIDQGYRKYISTSSKATILKPQDFVLPGWVLEIPR